MFSKFKSSHALKKLFNFNLYIVRVWQSPVRETTLLGMDEPGEECLRVEIQVY